jgi:hypothetical protein
MPTTLHPVSRLAVKYTIVAAPLLLLLSCGRHLASVNDPLPADQVASVLHQTFESADPSTRDAVGKIVGEIQQNQVAAAFTDIKKLVSQENLTLEQRITGIRAANTIGQQLKDAAQSGDEQAAETFHTYNATH